MKGDELLGEFDLVVGLQGGHRSERNASDHRGIDLRIRESEDRGKDPAKAHVEETAALQVDHFTSPCLAVVGGPLIRRKHLGTFAEELGAAGKERFRDPVSGLDIGHGTRQRESQLAPRAEAENLVHVGRVEVLVFAGLLQGEERFEPEQGGSGES